MRDFRGKRKEMSRFAFSLVIQILQVHSSDPIIAVLRLEGDIDGYVGR
jgi:hypothetical protein